MARRGLYVFKHDSQLGNAHAYRLFARIQPKLQAEVSMPRDFSDYTISVDDAGLPAEVLLTSVVR